MTDVLLSHPQYSAAINPAWIGGFGASMGGQAMANLLGARLTTSIGLACNASVRDPRIRAAVGLVPYSGQSFLPSFCDNQNGAEQLSRPYLAISGSADTTAPIGVTEQAVHRFGSSRYLVELAGVKHEYLPEHRNDVMTWTTAFLRAHVGGYVSATEMGLPGGADFAMARFLRMKAVTGTPVNFLRFDAHAPRDLVAGDPVAAEYYNDSLGHFFLTTDAGGGGAGWTRTNHAFRVSHQPLGDATPSVPVCRFYGNPFGGPDSHFYTANADECRLMKADPAWDYEGIAFWAIPASAAGECPAGMLKVLRAYNVAWPRADAPWRYTTSDATWRDLRRQGWSLEGVAWCASS
jgi:hypothetical protein